MRHAIRPTERPSGVTQKVAGFVDWATYVRFLEYCKRRGVEKMQTVGAALSQLLDREEAKEAEEARKSGKRASA